MANYNNLIAAVRDVIKQNDQNLITGDILQQTLIAIISALGGGYQFAGVATPETNPGTPDMRVFYLGNAGTYPNFGPAVVPSGYLGVFYYDAAWHLDTVTIPIGTGVITKDNVSNAFLAELLAGFVYAGVATPTGEPGTIVRDSFFLTTTPGSYPNYGNLIVASGEIALLRYSVAANTWTKQYVTIPDVLQLVDNLFDGGSNKALSARMGKVLGKAVFGDFDELDNDSLTPDDYRSASSRAYIYVKVQKDDGFKGSLQVREGSPIKYALCIRQNPANASPNNYDSGWLTGGQGVIVTDEDISVTSDRYLTVTATYISGGTGVPTFEEFLQYAEFSINSHKRTGGLVEDVDNLNDEVFGVDEEINVTQDNFTTYGQYGSTSTTNTRGYIPLELISKYFSLTVSVASGSPIKVAVQGRNTGQVPTPPPSPIYDSGWINPGGNYVAYSGHYKNCSWITLSFTYVSGNTGVPTIEEIKQYVTFEFVCRRKQERIRDILDRVTAIEGIRGVRPGIMAHRGLHINGIPENSLDAFRFAGIAKFDFVETDFSATADGYLVLMHDTTINATMRNKADYSTISGSVSVASKTLAELQAGYVLAAADKRYRRTIPLLEDFFKISKQYGMFPIPEIKDSGNTTQTVLAAFEMGCRILGEGNFGFCSATYALLDAVRAVSLSTPLFYIGNSILNTVSVLDGRSRNIPTNVWYPQHTNTALTAELVEQYHQLGMRVATWTVPISSTNTVIKKGVDIIASDFIIPTLGVDDGEWFRTDVDFSAFETTGVVVDNVLKLEAGQTVTLVGPVVWMGGYYLNIIAKGSFQVAAPNLNQSVVLEDFDSVCFLGLSNNRATTVTITANESTEIQFINLKKRTV